MTVPAQVHRFGRVSLKDDKPAVPFAPDELERVESCVLVNPFAYPAAATVAVVWDPSEVMMARTDRAYVNLGYYAELGPAKASSVDGMGWLGRQRGHGVTRSRHMHSVPGWTWTKQVALGGHASVVLTVGQGLGLDTTPNQPPDDDKWPLLRAWGAVTVTAQVA